MTVVALLETLREGVVQRLPSTPQDDLAAAQRVVDAIDELLAALFACEILVRERGEK
ncbi:MAG TPA: hypothetical protein VJ979_02595 [Actinomycetota bacterium]|nr:hypothetical protein [Actinomycetota bacterium]